MVTPMSNVHGPEDAVSAGLQQDGAPATGPVCLANLGPQSSSKRLSVNLMKAW